MSLSPPRLLAGLCVVLSTRALVRRSTARAIPAPRPNTLWFAEHALVNALLALMSLPGLCAAWRDPARCLDATRYPPDTLEGNPFPMVLALVLHLYHAVAYSVTAADAVHHFLFVSALTLPGCLFEWGALANAELFFICGLPGGLTYALLAAQRLNVSRLLSDVSEPLITACLHAMIRLPGILACTLCMIASLNARPPDAATPLPNNAPWWAITLQLVLAPLNAAYYTQDAVRRWRRRRAAMARGDTTLLLSEPRERTKHQ